MVFLVLPPYFKMKRLVQANVRIHEDHQISLSFRFWILYAQSLVPQSNQFDFGDCLQVVEQRQCFQLRFCFHFGW